jgi:UDP-N-acetylmuramoylalanine--D-glutamate ligase
MDERITVIGMARAGFSMAEALSRAGAVVTVVDQKPADTLEMLQAVDKLSGKGIEVVTSWTGDVDWRTTDVIATSPGVPKSHPTLREAVQRGVPIWSEIEVACRITKSPIIAITGTNGKSTVTALTWHILTHCNKSALLCGNIAGSGLDEKPISTAASTAGQEDILVAEVSSFQLEWIDTFRPRACTITNIDDDHSDRYAGFADYAAAKKQIYRNQRQDDFAVINLSRPETYDCEIRARRLTYGDSGDLSIRGNTLLGDGVDLNENELWLGGRHNLENAAASILLAHSQGVPLALAAEAVKSFNGIANRLEFIAEVGGVRYVNNSMCTNADALRASLNALDPPLILLAGGSNKSPDFSGFARIDSAKVRLALTFGRDAAQISAAFQSIGIESRVLGTLQETFEFARKVAVPGDTVVLSPGCASFDQFADFIARGDCFRALVVDLVEAVKT